MAERKEVTLKLRFDDQFSSGLDSATRSAKVSTDSIALGMMGIESAISLAGQAIDALKQGFEFAHEGAELQRLEETANTLAATYGQNMSEIVRAIKEASNHTISESDAMRSALQAMRTDVARTPEDFQRLTTAALALGRAAGRDATEAMTDLTSGTSKLSKQILDNLNIVRPLPDIYADYAAEMGMTVATMDDYHKKQAVVSEAMRAANPLLNEQQQLVADSATPFEQLTTRVEDFADRTKEKAVPVVTDLINVLNDLFDQFEESAKIKDDIEFIGGKWLSTYTDPKTKREMVAFFNEHGEKVVASVDSVYELAEMYEMLYSIHDERPDVFAEQERIDLLREEREAAEELAQAEEALKLAEEARLEALDLLVGTIDGPWGKAIDSHKEKEAGLIEQLAEEEEKLQRLREQGYWPTSQAIEDQEGKIDGLKQSVAELNEEYERQIELMLFEAVKKGMEEGGLTEAELGALMSLAEDWGIVDENTVAAREATETYLKLFESEGAEVANDWLNSWKENLVTTGDDLETFFQKWNDKTIHWRVVVAGGAAVGGSTTLTPGFASGGDWSGKGPIEVGELGPEFIFPKSHGGFAVVDASTTKLLKSMGISPRGGAYIPMLDPGDLGGPYIPLPPPPPTTPSAPPPSAPPPTTTPWSLPPGAGDVIDMYNAPSISLPEMASWNFLDLITGPSFPGMLMGVSLEEGAMMQFAERTGLRKKKGLEWWQLGKRAKLAQQMAAGLYPPEAFGTQATAARGPSPLDMLGNIAGRLIEGDAWQARTLANTYDTPWGQYIFGQGEFPGWDSFLGTGGSATPTPSGGRDWDRFYEITGVPIGLAGLSPNRPYTGMPHGDWGPVLSDYPWIQQIGDDRSRVGQWVTGMEEFGDGYLPPDFALPGVYDTLPTEMLSELLQRGDKNFESDYLDPLGFDQPAPSVWKPPHGGARGSLTSGTSAPPPPQPPIVISSPPQIEEPSERVPSLAPIIAAVSQSSTQLGQALVTTMSSGKATAEIARAGSDNAQLQILQRIAAAVEKQPDADQLRDIMRESQDTSGF